MTVVVGVDAGGTRTRAAIFEDGTERARREGSAGALRPGRALQAATAVTTTVREALAAAGVHRADALVVGAAGAGREPERSELEAALRAERLAHRVRVVTDAALAFAAAFGEGPGVLLVAGTGAVALARDAAGEWHRAGGYGWQMGDEGSGYWLGRVALRAIGRAHDGRAPGTALEARVLAQLRLADVDALVRWSVTASPPEVASLARLVADQAATDEVAATLLANGAAELTAQVLRAAAMAHLPAAEVAITGGLIGGSAPLAETVRSRLVVAGLRPRDGIVDAVTGVLRLAA
ncbi:MAG: BadF/BadG/BcrA/BcrD ATPase family protein [Gemmatimonadales bacterium]|nr:BadF/BadG/BcrA/BcrD ATPase family protein [Gemmatimonadales bacterium]